MQATFAKTNNFGRPDVDITMDKKDNIKTIWLILALRKKFESRPYDLSSSELMLLKSYDMSISRAKS